MSIPIETLTVGNWSMNYFRFGTGKIPFVMLPGLSVRKVMHSADLIAEAYSQFAEEFTVYVFDRRNELPKAYPIREAAEDTAAAIESLGLTDICLFGASQGGMLAMEIACNHPELPHKLVLASTSARMTEKLCMAPEYWVGLAREKKPEELYLSFGKEIYPPNVFEQLKPHLIKASESVTDEDLKRFICLAEGMEGFRADDLDRIACPVLVIGSKDDAVLGTEAFENIRKKLKGHPDAEFLLYDGYGHASFDTAPDFKDRVFRFFTR